MNAPGCSVGSWLSRLDLVARTDVEILFATDLPTYVVMDDMVKLGYPGPWREVVQRHRDGKCACAVALSRKTLLT